MTMSRIGAGLGTAAFLLGLSVVGPQGIASADTGDDDSSATPVASIGSAQSPAGQKAPARRSARDAGPSISDRNTASASSDSSAPSAQGRSAAGPHGAVALRRAAATVGSQSTPAVSVPTPPRLAAAAASAAGNPADPAEPPLAATDPSPVHTTSESDAAQNQPALLSEAVRTEPQAAVVTSTPPQAARANPLVELNAAVDRWFDDASSLLGTLPASPVSEFLQGTLLLVRRTLFNQAPTAQPVNYLIGPFGDTAGTVGAVDPEGDALTYTLTQQPRYGTVEIAQDGTYAYTPGSDFAGYDSFTVTVSDQGFNLLDPVQSRSVDAFVEVPYWSKGGPTTTFSIYNFTGQNITVAGVTHDPSVSNPIEPEPGLVVRPGDKLPVEIASALYSSLNPTRISLAVYGPFGRLAPPEKSWEVVLQPNLVSGTPRVSCSVGDCTFPGPQLTYSVLLVDPPGTVWDYSLNDPQAKQVLNALIKVNDGLAQETADGSVKPLKLSYEGANYAVKKLEESDYTPTNISATNNSGSETFKYSVSTSVTTTTTHTSNWEVEAGVNATILKVIDVAVAKRYGQGTEISESRTFTTTREETTRPYSFSTVHVAAPQINVTGDLQATFGPCTVSACTTADPNVTFLFRDLDYSYPDPTQADDAVSFYVYHRPYQEKVGEGFLIKDARTWADPTFPLDPTYQVGEKNIQVYAKGYLGATVGSAEDFTKADGMVLTSSNEQVATISKTGSITALSPGTTRITATYDWTIPNDRSGQVVAYMDVTVVPASA